MQKIELLEKFFEHKKQEQDFLGLLGLTKAQINTMKKSETLTQEFRKEIAEKISKVDQNVLIEKMFSNNNQLQDVMGLMESAQASKQKSSSASKGKGKAKRKTPKNQNLEELFEMNSQLQDMMGRLALAQNSRQEPKPESKQCNKDIGKAKLDKVGPMEELFEANNHLQDVLGLERFTPKSNLEQSSISKDCQKEIDEAKEKMRKVEEMEKSSEIYIFDYFEEIKRKVDLRREDLKFRIDTYSDEIIKSLEANQHNCIQLSKQINQMTANIEKSQKELNELSVEFDTLKFVVRTKKFEEMKKSVTVLNKELHKIVDRYQNSLVGNKTFSFQFENLPIEDIFGRLLDFETDSDMDSVIITGPKKRLLFNQLCQFTSSTKLKLLYRATRDGFRGEEFHERCDGIKNTVTIVKSEHGNVFGGYTGEVWESYPGMGEWSVDPKAFVFSLINKDKKPFKALCTDRDTAIYSQGCQGPRFGLNEINIECNSHAHRASSSEFGFTFKHPDYPQGTEKAKTILAGSKYFKTREIEVFAVTN